MVNMEQNINSGMISSLSSQDALMRFSFSVSCFHVLEYWHETRAIRLLHLTQVQNVHAIVGLAARRSGVFSSTFPPNGFDERQWSSRIKAVGCWSLGGVLGPSEAGHTGFL